MRDSDITSLVTSAKPAGNAGLTGLANGALLAAADQAGFEVLITVDQNMPNQQSLLGPFDFRLLVIRARSTNLDDLLVLLPDVMKALESLRPGEVVRIGISLGPVADVIALPSS